MKLVNEVQKPRLIQRLQWVFNPLELMETSAKTYGDFFALKLSNKQPLVLISDPQAIQEVFTTPPQNFGVVTQLLAYLLGENSLLLLEGQRHQQQRKLLTPPFHGERMKAYAEIINDTANEVINNLAVNDIFSVHKSMQEISLNIILKAVFGLKDDENKQKIQEILCYILDLSGSPLRSLATFFPSLRIDLGAWSPWGKFVRNKQLIKECLYQQIQQRRDNPELLGNDILSLMMLARDENGQGMSDAELHDELITLLFAGHETTASSLAYALYWIHSLPEVKEKLLQELSSLGENADLNQISRLPYLTAICQETLRIYPVAILTLIRLVKSPMTIMGYEFAPGTLLAPCIYLTHHRPDLYPEPEKFKPERFLERQYSQYEYLPFGGGNRTCIGNAFAMFEMKLVLAAVMSQLELELIDKKPIKPVRRGVVFAPEGGVKMLVKAKCLQTSVN